MELDRRVIRVAVYVRQVISSQSSLRWSYDLSYVDSPLGPAYYLHQVTKIYASGESEPPITYDYDLGEGMPTTATFEHLPALDDYLFYTGDTGLHPDRVAITDLEYDGLLDLEHYYAFTMVHQTEAGWTFKPLSSDLPWVDRRCRPQVNPFGLPRSLVRVVPEAAEPQVVYTRHWGADGETTVLVCSRDGASVFEQRFVGDWELDENARLSDLNRDNKPDILRVENGALHILENQSTIDDIAFAAHPAKPLADLQEIPTGTWVYDFDGDGIQDVLARTSVGAQVWYGIGNLRFVDQAVHLQLVGASGDELFDLSPYGMAFVDANKDGLMDILLSQLDRVSLYMNRGSQIFQEQPIAALESVGWDMSNPLIADMSGRGNTEIVYTAGRKAYALALNGPQTGLLRQVDDGKGTVIAFTYKRAPAWAGVGYRPSVLAHMSVSSSGYDDVSYDYDYEDPVMHSQGRYLVGYTNTSKTSPFLTEGVTFHNDDELSGVLIESHQTDTLSPDLLRFSVVDFDEVAFAGLRSLRPRSVKSGMRNLHTEEEIGKQEYYDSYSEEHCPMQTRSDNGFGTLIRIVEHADPELLSDALHCLSHREIVTGSHPADPSLDFRMVQQVERNALGQVVQVLHSGGKSDALVLQEVRYDARGRITEVSQPGRGSTTVVYEETTGIASEVVSPDGVSIRIARSDPLTGKIEEIVRDRGAGGILTSSFRYDGMERLERSWSDFGGSSAEQPSQRLRYSFATKTHPAAVHLDTLVDSVAGTYANRVELTAADGEAVANAARIPAGWAIGGLTARSRNERSVSSYVRSPVVAPDMAAVAYSDLFEGANIVAEQYSAGFGHAVDQRTLVQTGVEQTTTTGITTEDGQVITTVVEGTGQSRSQGSNGAGLTLWDQDSQGARTLFSYDALGRLVRVELADGAVHLLRFDNLGRPVRVERDAIGAFTYHYSPDTGLLERKIVFDSAGAAERTVNFQYDAIGRVIGRTHALVSTGEEHSFHFVYDGEGAKPLSGQRGYLTEVEGEQFRRQVRRNPDGSIAAQVLAIGDWREITLSYEYYASGEVRSVTRIVRDLDSGEIVTKVTQTTSYDAYGRMTYLRVDGKELARVFYDEDGRLDHADFGEDQVLAFHYDAVTQAMNGYWLDAGDWNAGVDWQLSTRGLVSGESMSFGDELYEQHFDYDDRGFLTTATNGEGSAHYRYSVSGQPEYVNDHKGVRELDRVGDTMRAGNDIYVYDDIGRVIQKGDLLLSYGPGGHLDHAQRGARQWEFVYDEGGNRLLKLADGVPVAAYVDGSYLTDTEIVEPLRIGGHLVGVLRNGDFQPLATDPRGSLVANEDGTVNLATPYGVREQYPALAPALDYVEKGYDADLGTVRMGVRDYDPMIAQFLTPDPLFLEDIDRCAQSPVECNLYGYAANNPLSFVDPSGTEKSVVRRFFERYFHSFRLGSEDSITSSIGDLEVIRKAKADWQSIPRPRIGTKIVNRGFRCLYRCFKIVPHYAKRPKLKFDRLSPWFLQAGEKHRVEVDLGSNTTGYLRLVNPRFVRWADVTDQGGRSRGRALQTGSVDQSSTSHKASASGGLEVGPAKAGAGYEGTASTMKQKSRSRTATNGSSGSNSSVHRRAVMDGTLVLAITHHGKHAFKTWVVLGQARVVHQFIGGRGP